MLYQFLPYNSDSVIYVSIHAHMLFFNLLFHHGLAGEIAYSSLCCTAGPVTYPRCLFSSTIQYEGLFTKLTKCTLFWSLSIFRQVGGK